MKNNTNKIDTENQSDPTPTNQYVQLRKLYREGVNLIEHGDLYSGILILKSIVLQQPDNIDAIGELTKALLICCKDETALPYAQRWTTLRPCESMPWAALSTALYGLNRHAEAREALDKAILVNSTDWLSLNRMAGVAAFLKYRLPEAEQLIRNALKLQPDMQTNWYVLGCVLKEQGKKIESMLCLFRAFQMNHNPSMSEDCVDMITKMGTPDFSQN
jgi:tetratricopeptide (TPR) repeat protein